MTSRLLQQRGRQDHHDAVLGHTFASYRGDRVIALDGNPDAGSLAYRIRRETTNTLLSLLAHRKESSPIVDRRAGDQAG